MTQILNKTIIKFKKQRGTFGATALLCVLFLSGCSSVQFEQFFKPVNMDKLSVYDQTRINCSIQTGLQSETDFAVMSSGIVSVGFRLPSSADQDFNYDRKFDDYHDCLRVDGL